MIASTGYKVFLAYLHRREEAFGAEDSYDVMQVLDEISLLERDAGVSYGYSAMAKPRDPSAYYDPSALSILGVKFLENGSRCKMSASARFNAESFQLPNDLASYLPKFFEGLRAEREKQKTGKPKGIFESLKKIKQWWRARI